MFREILLVTGFFPGTKDRSVILKSLPIQLGALLEKKQISSAVINLTRGKNIEKIRNHVRRKSFNFIAVISVLTDVNETFIFHYSVLDI